MHRQRHTQVADIRSQDREYERRGGMRTRNRNNNKVSNAAAVVVQNNNSGYNENDSVTSTLTSRSQSSLETPTKNRVIQRRASTTQSPSWSSSGREVSSNPRLRATNNKRVVGTTTLKRPVIVRRKSMTVGPSTLVPRSPHRKVQQEKKSTQPLTLKTDTMVSKIEQQSTAVSLTNVSSAPKDIKIAMEEGRREAKSIFREVLCQVPTPPIAVANLLEPSPTLPASSLPSLQPPREEIDKTAMVTLEEEQARVVVREVLRKAIYAPTNG